jgi:hypothetical protein
MAAAARCTVSLLGDSVNHCCKLLRLAAHTSVTVLFCACTAAAKFIIDKKGNVVERNGDNPLASEAKIKQLLAA